MTVDLIESRERATATLADLKRRSAQDILAGKAPDVGPVMAAQAALEALDYAESEQARRDREAAQSAHDARQAECRAELSSAAAARQEAVGRAERATRELAAALKDEREASRAMTLAFAGLGKPGPLSLVKTERERRLSEKIIATLKTGMEHPRRFGSIGFTAHREVPAGESWIEAEGREVNSAISPFTKG